MISSLYMQLAELAVSRGLLLLFLMFFFTVYAGRRACRQWRVLLLFLIFLSLYVQVENWPSVEVLPAVLHCQRHACHDADYQ